jgi:multidrug efflux pump subunit AcrB
VADEFAEKVKKIPGVGRRRASVKPGLPAYAVRLKPGAVRELGLTAPQLAGSLRAYVNGETATTGPRPTATRSTWCCA